MEQERNINPVRDTNYSNRKGKISNGIDQRVLNELVKSIQQINYGEVVITIHNSKIVQVEKKEKKRF